MRGLVAPQYLRNSTFEPEIDAPGVFCSVEGAIRQDMISGETSSF